MNRKLISYRSNQQGNTKKFYVFNKSIIVLFYIFFAQRYERLACEWYWNSKKNIKFGKTHSLQNLTVILSLNRIQFEICWSVYCTLSTGLYKMGIQWFKNTDNLRFIKISLMRSTDRKLYHGVYLHVSGSLIGNVIA